MTEVSYKNELSDQDQSIDSKKAEYIIPPGLYETFNEFIAHCEVAQDQPIMIVGDTGVGKSMFLHILGKLHEKRCKEKNNNSNIIWANCSHFGSGNSFPVLAQSALFGHVKGAFELALQDEIGLIEEANNGMLILDKISELPTQVQAMLLTFIETGKYRKLGSAENQFAKVQVVGTTNNEDALRDDFRFRFIPFYIPPLHERRQDILYYISAKSPDLINKLNCSEVLTLLAYHWPGNVREIDRVASLMLRNKVVSGQTYLKIKLETKLNDSELNLNETGYSFLNGLQPKLFLDWISSWDGDKFLIPYLKKHGLDLSNTLKDYPFNKLDASTVVNLAFANKIRNDKTDLIEFLELKPVPEIKAFDRAFRGFSAFCGLFGQLTTKNHNIMKNLKNGELYSFIFGGQVTIFTRYWLSKHLKEKSKPGFVIPEQAYEFWDNLEEQIDSYKLEDSLCELEKVNNVSDFYNSDYAQITIDINGMTEDQLLKIYYENLLSISGGIVKEAAKMAGVKENTFRGRLDKVGVSFRRLDKVG
jgi:DNA-binding NtrC family response regulator